MTNAPRLNWRRTVLWGAPLFLALSVASACANSTGPVDTTSPDSTNTRDPSQPGPGDTQGYVPLPNGLDGYLV